MRSQVRCAVLAAVLASSLAGCADVGDVADLGPQQSTGTVTLGSADDVAAQLEALIYADALRGIGTPVQVRLRLGPGDAATAAVERGEVTVAPALTGALWERYRPGVPLPASNAAEQTTDPKAQWDSQFVALSAVLPEGLGLGDPTLALDQPMLFVRPGDAASSLDGCVGVAGPVAVPRGTPTDLMGRYGCDVGPQIEVADDAAAASEVLAGRANAAQLGTLSPPAADLNQVADPESRVAPRAVAPLIRRDGVTVAQNKRLNSIAGELTTIDLAAMVGRVTSGAQTVEEAAAGWANDHPLH